MPKTIDIVSQRQTYRIRELELLGLTVGQIAGRLARAVVEGCGAGSTGIEPCLERTELLVYLRSVTVYQITIQSTFAIPRDLFAYTGRVIRDICIAVNQIPRLVSYCVIFSSAAFAEAEFAPVIAIVRSKICITVVPVRYKRRGIDQDCHHERIISDMVSEQCTTDSPFISNTIFVYVTRDLRGAFVPIDVTPNSAPTVRATIDNLYISV